MIVFPNAKINLGLRVLDKRPDGYHNIESYMIPVNFCDGLEIVPSNDGFKYSESGLPIDAQDDKNIVISAYRQMETTYRIKPVKIHLHKVIPVGAGLGGGSSDGAFTISLLRRLYDLKICDNELEELSGLLGSDCPFFIINKPQKIEGKGTPTRQFLRVPQYYVVIIIPPIQISTAWAYNVVKPSNIKLPDPKTLLDHENQWKDLLFNDFEEVIFKHHPELEIIKADLYKAGAFYASMSGSGSAIYGLFSKPKDTKHLFKGYTVWQGETIV